MHVFLTGASEYIGSAVAHTLRAAGHVVSGLARSDAAASRLSAAGIQPIRGNFTDPKSISAAAHSADGVISMATTYDPDVDGSAIDAMLTALTGSNKPMLYTSGIWSHGDTGGKVVDETSPPRPAALVQWRQAVEERVLDAAREGSAPSSSGLPSCMDAAEAFLLGSWIPPSRNAGHASWEPGRTGGPSCTSMILRISTSWRWSTPRQELSYSR